MSYSNLHYLHRQMSAIHHAAVLTFEDVYFALVKLEWNPHTYLTVEVECYQKDAEKVAARMNHGLLVNGYDYRFSGVAMPTGNRPDDLVKVSGRLNLGSKGFFDKMVELAA